MNKFLIPITLSFVAGGVAAYLFLPNESHQGFQSDDKGRKSYATSEYSNHRDNISKLSSQKGRVKSSRYRHSFIGYSSEDFERAAGELEKLLDQERALAEVKLFSAWARKDPEAALAYIEKESHIIRSVMTKPLVYGVWAENDPENASIKYGLDSKLIGGWIVLGGTDSTLFIAKNWGRSDPERASEYVRGLVLKSSILDDYILSLYHQSREVAYQQLASFSEEDQDRGIRGIAGLWGDQEDWTIVEEKIEKLPTGLQDQARLSAMQSFITKGVADAKEQIDQFQLEPEQKDQLITGVFHKMVNEDIMNNLEWAMQRVSEENYIELFATYYKSQHEFQIQDHNSFQWYPNEETMKRFKDSFVKEAEEDGGLSQENIEKLKDIDFLEFSEFLSRSLDIEEFGL